MLFLVLMAARSHTCEVPELNVALVECAWPLGPAKDSLRISDLHHHKNLGDADTESGTHSILGSARGEGGVFSKAR